MRLSEFGRALEEMITLAKTETRLSRNLGRPELRAHLGAAILRELYEPLLAGAHSFIIRNTGVRHVLAGRRKVDTTALADGIHEVCAGAPRRAQPGAKDPPHLTPGFG